jgi:hypothetical protein
MKLEYMDENDENPFDELDPKCLDEFDMGKVFDNIEKVVFGDQNDNPKLDDPTLNDLNLDKELTVYWRDYCPECLSYFSHYQLHQFSGFMNLARFCENCGCVWR